MPSPIEISSDASRIHASARHDKLPAYIAVGEARDFARERYGVDIFPALERPDSTDKVQLADVAHAIAFARAQ